MSKNNQQAKNQNINQQQKISNTVNSGSTENPNQNHNTKKEALGPNTKR